MSDTRGHLMKLEDLVAMMRELTMKAMRVMLALKPPLVMRNEDDAED